VDLAFAAPVSRELAQANAKSKTPLETYICWPSLDSNIGKDVRRNRMRRL